MKKKIIWVLVILSLVLLSVYWNWDKIRRYRYGVAPGVTLNGKAVDYMLKSEVERYVRKKAEEITVLPQNAYFNRETGEIVPEKPGFFLNINWTVDSVMEAAEKERVALKIIKVDPKITREFLENINKEIGSYSTVIGGGGNRAINIRLATSALNYYLLAPGEIFSFNRANGPRTYERGYRPAPVIVGNTVIPGIGGGVCQVSTTLYNAVDRAGLEIVERYRHTQPIDYVPPGRDATISDYLDFKFRNNTDRYILIKSWADWAITFKIYTHD